MSDVIAETCCHKYRYLRQDKKNTGYDRNPIYVIEDVFFCCKCLKYKRVGVEKHTPKTDGGNYVERLV